MNKLLLASLALVAVGMTAPAKAADMPVKYVAPAPVFTWTGCYVGVHIGYKWGQSKQEYTGYINGVPVAPNLVGTDLTGNYDVDGPVGGAQGGCNYQTGAWVWGVEVDGAWSSASGQASTAANAVALGFNQNFLWTTNERWLSTARGRLGWAADRWMWYVTGGAAWSGFDVNNSNPLVATQQRQPTRVNKTGWIVGVGTEYALLGGWSVKSELLYANFGSLGYGQESGIVNGCTLGCYSADVKMSEFIWRVGMNYRFDWASWGKGKAPVVAKY
jgi:outer membrane immunogenic protein